MLLSACGSGRAAVDGGEEDAGGSRDGNVLVDAARIDAGAADDAGGAVDASADFGELPDGAACYPYYAECAEPPAGYAHCGGGAIDPAMASAACNALDPVMDLGMLGLTKSCSAFTVTSGHYDVWCGPSDIYVWASFDMLTSSAVTTCMLSATLPDGGVVTGTMYRPTWGLEDSNDQLYANVSLTGGGIRSLGMLTRRGWPYSPEDVAIDATHWAGGLAYDGHLPVPASTTGGMGAVYYAVWPDDCMGIPTAAQSIVLAVPISFTY